MLRGLARDDGMGGMLCVVEMWGNWELWGRTGRTRDGEGFVVR